MSRNGAHDVVLEAQQVIGGITRTLSLAWGAGGIGGEITRGVLMAAGGLAGMAILVVLASLIVSAVF